MTRVNYAQERRMRDSKQARRNRERVGGKRRDQRETRRGRMGEWCGRVVEDQADS